MQQAETNAKSFYENFGSARFCVMFTFEFIHVHVYIAQINKREGLICSEPKHPISAANSLALGKISSLLDNSASRLTS
jgi:hypothetical protein